MRTRQGIKKIFMKIKNSQKGKSGCVGEKRNLLWISVDKKRPTQSLFNNFSPSQHSLLSSSYVYIKIPSNRVEGYFKGFFKFF